MKKLVVVLLSTAVLCIAGCEKPDENQSTVTSLTVTPTSISFDGTGGSLAAQTIYITSSEKWTASCDADWLIISQTSGYATDGAEVSVYALENTGEARTATITVSTSMRSDLVTVYQDAASTSYGKTAGDGTKENPYSVTEALEIINNGTYTNDTVYVRGYRCGSSGSSITGAYYLYMSDISLSEDEDNWLFLPYCYGFGKSKFTIETWVSFMGSKDEFIICGVLTMGDSTPEIAPGCYLYYWDGKTVEYESDDVIGDGSADNPYTFDDIYYLVMGGTAIDEEVCVKGIVSRIDEMTSDGSISYYISDNGKSQLTLQIYIENGLSFGRKEFSAYTTLNLSDEVVVKGIPIIINDSCYSPTVYSGGCFIGIPGGYLYSLNGNTSDDSGDNDGEITGTGTKDDPYSVGAALEIITNGTYTDDTVYVKGYRCGGSGWSSKIGYAYFYMSDSGTYADEDNRLFLPYCYGFGKSKFTDETFINFCESEDEFIICGVLTMEDSTPEIAPGCYLYYWNGKTVEYESDDVTGDGSANNPYTFYDIYYLLLGRTKIDEEVCVKGIVSKKTGMTSDGSISYYISDNGTYDSTYQIYIEDGLSFSGEVFSVYTDLTMGDEVVLCGVPIIIDDSFYGVGHSGGCYIGIPGGYLYSRNGKTNNEGNDDEVEDVCNYMTDSYFKSYCLSNCDKNGDGKVSLEEAEAWTEINHCMATDYAGIEYFTNLKKFTSQYVKTIYLGSNTKLNYIYLNGAPITELDLSCNLELTEIVDQAFYNCHYCPLKMDG